ncbi:MAG: hypothetical protein V3R44_05470, partial [bacterium]
FLPQSHIEHRGFVGVVYTGEIKACNAGGRWPPIRVDRRGPQRKVVVLFVSPEPTAQSSAPIACFTIRREPYDK